MLRASKGRRVGASGFGSGKERVSAAQAGERRRELHRKVFSRRGAGWYIPSRARNEGFTGKAPAARQVGFPTKCFCKCWRERMGEARMKLCPVECGRRLLGEGEDSRRGFVVVVKRAG